MTEIKIVGKRQIGDTEITHIEGGFGDDTKCVLVKDIAKKHKVETKYINKIINQHMSKFSKADIVDLKTGSSKELVLSLGFTNAQYGNANNIYMFSERGYIKLVSMMDNTNETKWVVMQEFIDNYFKMREEIKNNVNEMDLAILSVVKANTITDRMIAMNEYNNKIVKPLQTKIEEQKPLVDYANRVGDSSDKIDIGDFAKMLKDENIDIGRNRLFQWFRDNRVFMKSNIPYQKYIDSNYFEVVQVVKNTPYGEKIFPKTVITGKGTIYFTEKITKEFKGE